LKVEKALRIAIEAAQALQAAHRKGIVHSEVKNANVILDAEDRVVITGFLLGKLRLTPA